MFNENDIVNKLKEIIEGISGVAVVYAGVPQTIEKYSAVMIFPSSWTDSNADLRDTSIDMEFKIVVYVQTGSSPINAQQQLRDLVRLIRIELGKQDNIELNGLVDYSKLTEGEYIFTEAESGLYSCSITYKAIKRFNRS